MVSTQPGNPADTVRPVGDRPRAVNQFQVTDLIIILFLGLGAGYFVVSFLIPERLWKNLRKRSRPGPGFRRSTDPPATRVSETAAPIRPDLEGVHPMTERDHARVLGLKGRVTLHQIKIAYRNEIAKYHPDKVNHLAPEFQELARERTRLIRNAYEYFRERYHL